MCVNEKIDYFVRYNGSCVFTGFYGSFMQEGGQNDRIILSDAKRKPLMFRYCVIAIYNVRTQ